MSVSRAGQDGGATAAIGATDARPNIAKPVQFIAVPPYEYLAWFGIRFGPVCRDFTIHADSPPRSLFCMQSDHWSESQWLP